MMIMMAQRVAGVQQGAIWTLIDLDTLSNAHRRGDARQHLCVHGLGERCAVRGFSPCCRNGSPGQPAPSLPQIVRPGGNAGYGHGRRSDLVRHVLTDEDHFDGLGVTWTLAAKARHADEEVQAAHLAGCCIEDGRKAPATQPGEDGFRCAADEHHRHGRVDRAAALGEDFSPGLRRRRVPGGDAGADHHRTPILTPASLTADSPGYRRIADRRRGVPQPIPFG